MSAPAKAVFIGYDQSEDKAYQVCRSSMLRHSAAPLHVTPLRERGLRHIGLYERPWEVRGKQKYDVRDGKPFSTDFAFTRFLVPALMQHEGWALFCDLDFLFTADLDFLFDHADDRYAALVVMHDHTPTETEKMGGKVQTTYLRKNWSSLVLWNCGHPSNKALTPQAVNSESGQWLHAFSWLDDTEIGGLPKTWNWLSGVSDKLPKDEVPKGIHYTLGGPWFLECQTVPYASLWLEEEAGRYSLGNGEWDHGKPTRPGFYFARDDHWTDGEPILVQVVAHNGECMWVKGGAPEEITPGFRWQGPIEVPT
jgi:hypothetical protein